MTITMPDCEMARAMNDEIMMLEIDESLCAVSGCNTKAVKHVSCGRGVSVFLCKEHL